MNALTIWLIAFAVFLVNLFNVLIFIFSTVKKVINLQQVQYKIHKFGLLDKCVINTELCYSSSDYRIYSTQPLGEEADPAFAFIVCYIFYLAWF